MVTAGAALPTAPEIDSATPAAITTEVQSNQYLVPNVHIDRLDTDSDDSHASFDVQDDQETVLGQQTPDIEASAANVSRDQLPPSEQH